MRKWLVCVAVLLMVCFVVETFAGGGEGDAKPRKERRNKERAKEAQARRPQRGPRAMGQVKSIDVDGGKVVVAMRKRGQKEPEEKTFVINAETEVRVGWEKKTLGDVKADANVMIRYKEAAEGENPVVTMIMVRIPSTFGTVKSIDAEAKKIVVSVRARRRGDDAQAQEKTYVITDETKVFIGREEKTLADVAAEKRVMVQFKKGEDGAEIATMIRVMERRQRQPRNRDKKKEADA